MSDQIATSTYQERACRAQMSTSAMVSPRRRSPLKKIVSAAEQDRPGIAAERMCWREGQLYAKVPHGHWKTTTFVAALRHDGIRPDQWRMFPRLCRNGARSNALAWRHRCDR